MLSHRALMAAAGGGGAGTAQIAKRVPDSGSYIGNMTVGTGLADHYDDDPDDVGGYTSTAAAWTGLTLTTATPIFKAVFFGAQNVGMIQDANPTDCELKLYGKAGTAPSTSTDGDLLGTVSSITDIAKPIGTVIPSSDIATVYDHVWCTLTATGGAERRCSEVYFFGVVTTAEVSSHSIIADGTGTAIGNMTGFAGLAGAFDGANDNAAGSAQSTIGTYMRSGMIGKDWGSGNDKIISKFSVSTPTDSGIGSVVSATTPIYLELLGSDDDSTYYVLSHERIMNTAYSQVLTVDSEIDVSTAYRYHKIRTYHHETYERVLLGEVNFYEAVF